MLLSVSRNSHRKARRLAAGTPDGCCEGRARVGARSSHVLTAQKLGPASPQGAPVLRFCKHASAKNSMA
eukprot:3588100-Alexandrium_andersonii.AAC.1